MKTLLLFTFIFSWTDSESAHLEPHSDANLRAEHFMDEDLSKIRGTGGGHLFRSNCIELLRKCEHEARGLMIMENECYKTSDHRNIRKELFPETPHGDKPLRALHNCKYYTCRTFMNECIRNAKVLRLFSFSLHKIHNKSK